MWKSILLLPFIGLAAAENGLAAWLRYAPIPGGQNYHASLPSHIVALNSSTSSPVYTGGQEIQKGLQSIFGKECDIHQSKYQASSAIVIGTLEQYAQAYGNTTNISGLIDDGFWLDTTGDTIRILGQNERGAIYGAFEYLSLLAQGNLKKIAYVSNPAVPVRWTNEWDNLDGSIERGFAGNSLWFVNGTVSGNLTRAAEYARLLASIGINGVMVHNVNANASILTPQNIEGLGRIADVMRPYGVQIGTALLFSSPTSGVTGQANLTTFDPLDESVVAWWTNVTAQIYRRVPDFAGYLVKANSEVCIIVVSCLTEWMLTFDIGTTRTSNLQPYSRTRCQSLRQSPATLRRNRNVPCLRVQQLTRIRLEGRSS
jgi:alpha-glucuronidase